MQVRPLTATYAGEAAHIHRAAFDERLPWLAGLHTPDEDREFWRERVFRDCEVHGVFDGDRLIGVMALRDSWIDQLYVFPDAQGRGAGTALLRLAQAGQSDLSLWTFQKNTGARRFYERNGFAAVEETDGSGNEEREPDVCYRWRR